MTRLTKQLEGLRSTAKQHRVTFLLLAVIGLALGLRVWGIGFGLPYDFTYDEPHEILRAFKLGAGEYHWGGGKGGLYYLLFMEYSLIYAVWWMTGRVADTQAFALQVLQDPSIFYLAGRLTVALMGTMTCLVIFFIGRLIYDWRVGLGAAFIGALAYSHGSWSHYINVDIGLTLALWASLWAYLRYEETRSLRWLLSAGALGGVAIAFKLPGAIVLLPLLLGIVSHGESWQSPYRLLKELGVVLVALIVTLAVISPETLPTFGYLHTHFSHVIGQGGVADDSSEANLATAGPTVTIFRDKNWLRYFNMLLEGHNVVMTLSALLGAGLGLLRKHRWSIILSVLSVIFLGILTAADRPGSEYYLLPMMPALWLLSSRAVVTVLEPRQSWIVAGLGCVVVLPLMALVRQDYIWTKPDTRVLAKAWIEENIPSGSKILMDGMQYRFTQSPPLNPNRATVERRISQAGKAERLSRGVSGRTLMLYAEAMDRLEGPTYTLYSTVWGAAVEDLSYYIQDCFDYIITSSYNSNRYVREIDRNRFPKSARFYEQLQNDSRFRVIYSIEPVPWKSGGPTITVYKVPHACATS
jgi:hypothetical protein